MFDSDRIYSVYEQEVDDAINSALARQDSAFEDVKNEFEGYIQELQYRIMDLEQALTDIEDAVTSSEYSWREETRVVLRIIERTR